MDTVEFAAFLAMEADRVVASAAGTLTASETYRLMMDMRHQLFKGEEVLSWSLCIVTHDGSDQMNGLVVLTDTAIYLSHSAANGKSVIHVSVSRAEVPPVKWRAATIARDWNVVVVVGLPDFALPEAAARQWETVLERHEL